jgi:hypothetical protein
MSSKSLTRVVRRIKTIRAKQANAKRSLARSGEFNILWAIVAVVGIALALFMIFYVFHGAMPSLGASNTLTVTAEELGGVLVINIKAMGVSAVTIKDIYLSPSGAGASGCAAYLNGNLDSNIPTQLGSSPSTSSSSSGSSPTSLYNGWVTLKPGDTLSITCTSISGSPTEVVVVTSSSTYVAPIS